VLDCPCGAGRVAYHLARLGCRVTGADITPSYVGRARRRFKKEGLAGTFTAVDMREIEFDRQFHAAFNWSGSFGFFSDEQNAETLGRYARALPPGGRLLIDLVNRENLLRNFRGERRHGDLTVCSRLDRGRQRVESTWIVDHGGRKTKAEMSFRLYTPAQTKNLFAAAGLKVEALYGSRNGEEYRRSSPRLIVVGRKEGRR
jgi:SAM-dependent methyltransferase